MSVRVKICGITNIDDALVAIDAGADALGFVFCEQSPRCLTPAGAARILNALPPLVAKVGLFVNSSADFVRHVLDQCAIDGLQLHGNETPEFCASFRLWVLKAFRMRGEATLNELPRYPTAAWLLDSYVPGQPGGTGETFNWDLASRATRLGRPVILAGGLTPGNVADAVRQVRPYGVDVSSGVEAAPGRKDASKVRDFIQAAKQAVPGRS